ncbi:MAG: hypothetical protein Kow0063_03060 [Anaerolineae bacterium]
MQKLIDRLNRSRALGNLISFASTRLAHYRGVPILIGVVLSLVSFAVHVVAAVTQDTGWSIAAFTVLHVGIFVGFLGILLAEPLGRS